jgi:hypothetical protein
MTKSKSIINDDTLIKQFPEFKGQFTLLYALKFPLMSMNKIHQYYLVYQ